MSSLERFKGSQGLGIFLRFLGFRDLGVSGVSGILWVWGFRGLGFRAFLRRHVGPCSVQGSTRVLKTLRAL